MKYPTYESDHYILQSGVESHRENPNTFYLPPENKRKNLCEGDIVKLMFRMEEKLDSESIVVERMWVSVQKSVGGIYQGVLGNDPYHDVYLESGRTVYFGSEHVIQIYEENAI